MKNLFIKKSLKGQITKLLLALLVLSGCSKDDYILEANKDTSSVKSSSNNCSIGTANTDLINIGSASYQVNNLASLKQAIIDAIDGDIIYIEDSAIINVPELDSIVVDKAITIASSRGANGKCGAIIKTDAYGLLNATTSPSQYVNNSASSNDPIFIIKSSGVRITGIRFQGPYGNIGSDRTKLKVKQGINIKNKENHTTEIQNITVDNCELYDFPYFALNVDKNVNNNIVIKHNYFHNNIQSDLGYGVAIGGEHTFALITYNVFDNNRHDITSSGREGSGYEASYNLVGYATNGNFDIHGSDHTINAIAGHFTHIHHNTFTSLGAENVLVRGIPTFMCLIEKNKFANPNMNQAVSHGVNFNGMQILFRQNLLAWNNIYDWNETNSNGNYKGVFISRSWEKKGKDFVVLQPFYRMSSDKRPAILFSSPTTKPYEQDIMMDFELGDFDGDGKTEIFKSFEGNWYLAEIPLTNNSYNALEWQWNSINTSGKSVLALGFGDFNGNGTTDAFNANGADWYISEGAQSGWSLINPNTTTTLNLLRFGNFNQNATTDVFKANQEGWHLSEGGSSEWDRINTSQKPVIALGFGDFNGNGTTDVLNANGTDWYISEGGQSGWSWINASEHTIDKLKFGDFDENGTADVFVKSDSLYYRISEGGSTNWKKLTYKKYSGRFDNN
ncbi:hypothetical protein [Aquimarina algiphila]|uniref:hypothetical protein n=1 Tax=Aquimarina algiphila TaxID=2047982 RepID=UPI00232ADD7C|nr:hypothetical protein [Aquimarina algiphila]